MTLKGEESSISFYHYFVMSSVKDEKIHEDVTKVDSDSELFSDEEDDVDPFLAKPFKDRISRHLRHIKKFFTKKKYRVFILKSILPKIRAYYVEPESNERMIVNLLMVVTILWNVVSIPYRTCLEDYTHSGFRVIDVLTDVVAWLSLLFHLLQAVESHGELKKSRKESLRACFNIWFLIEVLTYIPVDYFIQSPWARTHRILGILYYNQYMNSVEDMAAKLPFLDAGPVVLRIIKFSFYLLITIHWLGCLFIALANMSHKHGNYMFPEGGPSNDLLINDVFLLPGSDSGYVFRKKFRQYVGGLYFSTLLIVGYGAAAPQNEADVVYSLVSVVGGTALFATIVGTVVTLINQLGATEQAFNEKMQNIKDYMRFRNVNERLQKDAFTFFSIVQRSGRGVDQEEIMGDLEMSIKRNIAQYLHRNIVSQVPLFQQCGELFIQDICQYLKYTLLLTGYRIVNKGEIGKEMFFIGKGSVEVISEDGNIVFAKLEAGKFFGEIALLSADARRTASIRAAELCEVYVLMKEDFDNVIGRYPNAKIIMQEEIERRQQATAAVAQKAQSGTSKLKTVVKMNALARKRRSSTTDQESDQVHDQDSKKENKLRIFRRENSRRILSSSQNVQEGSPREEAR